MITAVLIDLINHALPTSFYVFNTENNHLIFTLIIREHKIGYSVYISYTLRLANNMTDTLRLSNNTRTLLDDESVIRRIFDHIDNNNADMGSECWQEPVEHYQSQAYFEVELSVLRLSLIHI